ncbi:hypothetical protein T265_02905 [Opisthorchis viverrini]|uniref:Uncharacterized protein n=1 Tax=Opisthorchis viverrini TaxID=6198 RepID=A0A074ZUH2_OPIVI|nr:hypothetical protein T265_02905 [Opisthorchis viverrini]KER30761.1 hypothetical protein T265_02905 [Opisthorchis viverrini]
MELTTFTDSGISSSRIRKSADNQRRYRKREASPPDILLSPESQAITCEEGHFCTCTVDFRRGTIFVGSLSLIPLRDSSPVGASQ